MGSYAYNNGITLSISKNCHYTRHKFDKHKIMWYNVFVFQYIVLYVKGFGEITICAYRRGKAGIVMLKTNVGSVRQAVSRHIGSKVVVRCNLGRHKVDVTEGIITETFPSIFLITVKNEIENTSQTVSYSYTDVLTKDVQITLCKA